MTTNILKPCFYKRALYPYAEKRLELLGWSKGMVLKIDRNPDGNTMIRKA